MREVPGTNPGLAQVIFVPRQLVVSQGSEVLFFFVRRLGRSSTREVLEGVEGEENIRENKFDQSELVDGSAWKSAENLCADVIEKKKGFF